MIASTKDTFGSCQFWGGLDNWGGLVLRDPLLGSYLDVLLELFHFLWRKSSSLPEGWVWPPLLWEPSWRKEWGSVSAFGIQKTLTDFRQLGLEPPKSLAYPLQRINFQTSAGWENQVPGSMSNFSEFSSWSFCFNPPPLTLISRHLVLPILRQKILWSNSGWFSSFPSADLRFHFLRCDLRTNGPFTF